MNKRQINILLLVAVVGIWGYVVYSKFVGPTVDNEQNLDSISVQRRERIVKKDSFVLKANYRDPFLGKTIKTRPKIVANPNPSKTKIHIKKTPDAPISWPTIRYYGLIQNTSKTNAGTGLVSINGKSHKIKKKSQIKDITVITINRDSITLKLKKDIKVFHSKKKRR